jgi:glutamate-ammonia-ligase adenylyltransferase
VDRWLVRLPATKIITPVGTDLGADDVDQGAVRRGDAALAGEFLEMVQPFRSPRSDRRNVLDEVAAMKQRIENEVVKAGELERNVKLGRGGIREIEFVAQSLQLLHAGRNPFLQSAQNAAGAAKARAVHHLSESDVAGLTRAYSFMRDIEHRRLQMEHNRQTHTIPVLPAARERVARVRDSRASRHSRRRARN